MRNPITISKIAIIFVSLALAATLWFVSAGDHARNRGPGKSFGSILIDSPEIYTRERLVNDRFREDAWLKSTLENLKKLSEEKFGFQGIARSLQLDRTTMQLDLHASGQVSNSKVDIRQTESQGDNSGAKHLSAIDKNKIDNDAQTRAQLRDDFRQLLDIRDAIRKEIIENQLDDRHDIGVNTLYCFKFDATLIIPGNDTSAWAKIQIAMTKSDSGTLVDALKKRYMEWINHLEMLVNKEFRDRRSLISKVQKDIKIRLLDYGMRHANLFPKPEHPEAQGAITELADRLTRPEHDRVDKQLNRIIARLQHEGIIPLQSRQSAMNWLVAKWVIFELLERPGLGRFVTTEIIPLGERNLSIGVSSTIRKPSIIQKGFEFEAQQVEGIEIDDKSGLEKFLSTFLSNEYKIFTYTVSPKQSVERISDAATYERSHELLSSIVASQEPANVKTALKLLREQNADIRAIRRNAIIVGFANHRRDPNQEPQAVFGWLIGPRFQVSNDGTGIQYRHVSVQNSLSALVSLPSGWPQVKINVQTSWIKEDGSEHNVKSHSYNISLPLDVDRLTDAVSGDGCGGEGSKPLVFQSQMDNIILREGDPAQVLIPGRNLWRSTVVTIGTQPSDRIIVLPNMEGIIAQFDKIRAPAWGKKVTLELKLRVWTSTGMILLPQKVHLYRKDSTQDQPT